jgi:Tfp pilus assembly protein PilW
MDCKRTSIDRRRGLPGQRGWTLPETMVSVGVTSLLLLVLVAMFMTSGRAFVALSNYVDLDAANKVAMDTLTRDVRECNRVTSASETSINLEDADGSIITYTYSPSAQTFVRSKNGVSRTLLTQCDAWNNKLYTRVVNPGAAEDLYVTSNLGTAKVVEIRWNCFRTIFGTRANTESVQTARIVIRRQRPA